MSVIRVDLGRFTTVIMVLSASCSMRTTNPSEHSEQQHEGLMLKLFQVPSQSSHRRNYVIGRRDRIIVSLSSFILVMALMALTSPFMLMFSKIGSPNGL